MCVCCKEIRWGKVFISAIIFAVIDQIVHIIGAHLTMSYYTDPAMAGLWSKVMMSAEGPPPASFFIYSVLLSFLVGFVLAASYDFLRPRLENASFAGKLFTFFFFAASLSVVMGYMPMYLFINIPFLLIVAWFIQTLISYFINIMVFVGIFK
ncbi:MAG: hypothetical protein ABIH00_03600 [Armatimonadota bacterium]